MRFRGRWLAGALGLAAALAAPAARAQYDRYEAQFGPPVEVQLSDLVINPESYNERAVRTRGRLEPDMASGRLHSYVIRDTGSNSVEVVALSEVAGAFDADATQLLGRTIDITGVFQMYGRNDPTSRAAMQSIGRISFWKYLGPPEELSKSARDKAAKRRLEELVSDPGKRDGELVRVVGQFRGSNLFGDLPVRSELSSGDWVIKDDLYAVWITDKKPKGSGFNLDPKLKRDTGKWMEVLGRVHARGRVTYIQAIEVSLTSAPSATAQAAPAPPPPERPKLPPEIVFSLPLDGERDVAPDGSFTIQFSKDMREESFFGHVAFRYSGAPRPGDRGFEGIRFFYDAGKRALTVVPGDRLQPGRTVELVLLDGILDDDGLPLKPRPGRFFDSAIEILRWQARAAF